MPGLRSRKELLQRYGIKRREIERTSPESPSILAEGVGIRDEKTNGLVSGPREDRTASRLGEILPTNGMGAMVPEADEAWAVENDSHAD
jgi:hypothetical protein